MSKFLELALIATCVAAPVIAEPLGLGRTATPNEIAAWDIDVRPDGMGLPKGQGDVATGDKIFTAKCASCHGVFGEGTGRWPVLAGGQGSLTAARPAKTIGSYWPYLSTVYDYVNRAMPFGDAQSLEPNDVYAITAYLLYLNDEVDEGFVLSSDNFDQTSLPNEAAFVDDDRVETEFPLFTQAPCMSDCKDSVEITMRAAVLDVTPEETAAKDEADAELAVAMETPATDVPDPALVAAGEAVFRKCKSCHQIGAGAKNRVGPLLTGIVDAPAGAVADFRYSKALQGVADAGLIWNREELSAFLVRPKSYLKGTKMSFPGLKDESDINALIAYLRSVPD